MSVIDISMIFQYFQKQELIKYTMTEIRHSDLLNEFISLVPKHLRKFIKCGVFVVPNNVLIQDYESKKSAYLETIKNTQKDSVNSMHKYTSNNPISKDDIEKINSMLTIPLNQYYSLYIKHLQFKNKQPELFQGFSITYNEGHKGLNLHVDDSIYTVNLCLSSNAQGNEVFFNQMVGAEPLEDYAFIHAGNIPHHTNEIISGQRVNVVLWFK